MRRYARDLDGPSLAVKRPASPRGLDGGLVKLPDVTPVSAEALCAIAARHGLHFDRAEVLVPAGIMNTVYAVSSEYVLRVPRAHAAHGKDAFREAAAIPVARAAGMRTPRLVAFDDACDILPVPYLVTERVDGVNMEALGMSPPDPPQVWAELGRDLARLHARSGKGLPSELGPGPNELRGDPRSLVESRATDGWISAHEARWLLRWLDRLAPEATGVTVTDRFLHGDVQMSNVLVDPENGAYRATIDFGCAGWGDPVTDFVAVPMRAVPLLLVGHREVAQLEAEETVEARILWHRLHLVFRVMPRGSAAGTSWGERPIAWLADLLHFFVDPPYEWRRLGPA